MDSKSIYVYINDLENQLESVNEKDDELTTNYVALFTEYEMLLENACRIAETIAQCPHMTKNLKYEKKECKNCEFSNRKKNRCWNQWLRGTNNEVE